MDELTADDFISRARAICAAAHGIVPGFCRDCATSAIAEVLTQFNGRRCDEPGIRVEMIAVLKGVPEALRTAYLDDLYERSRRRCSSHRGATTGFCSQCFRQEIAIILGVENPTMNRDDVAKLVDEWILAADSPAN